jgi:spermidine synthase
LINAQINRDRNLRLQYLAGFQLNTNVQWAIYDDMVSYRRFPENIFVGTGVFSILARKAIEETVSPRHDGAQN